MRKKTRRKRKTEIVDLPNSRFTVDYFVWILGKEVGEDFEAMRQPFQGEMYNVAFTTLEKAREALRKSDEHQNDPQAKPSNLGYKPVKYRLGRLYLALQTAEAQILILDSGGPIKLIRILPGVTLADVLGEDGSEGPHES